MIRTGRASLTVLLLLAALTAVYPVSAVAFEDLHVLALFKDRAVLMIDGKRHLLSAGETSPEGVKLVAADSDGAVFEYRGEILERGLDGRVRAAATLSTAGQEVYIYRNVSGMFRTVGSINGMPVDFLVDTGASAVAMNSAQARRLGIDYRVEGDSTHVATASDVLQAFRVRLDVVKVGSIQIRNVDAVILEGSQPREVLLGMSFLGRLEMINQDNKLILRRKY